MNEGEFDHSPGLITVYPRQTSGKKPFKYFTMWKSSLQFGEIIKRHQSEDMRGTKMYVISRN